MPRTGVTPEGWKEVYHSPIFSNGQTGVGKKEEMSVEFSTRIFVAFLDSRGRGDSRHCRADEYGWEGRKKLIEGRMMAYVDPA